MTVFFLLAGSLLSSPSKDAGRAALLAAWEEGKPVSTVTRFIKRPEWDSAYVPGQPDETAYSDAVRYIKFCRKIAGLPNDFVLDADLSRDAQWGSILMAKNQSVSHRLPQPKGMDEETYSIASQGLARSNLGMMHGRPTCLAEMVHMQLVDNYLNAWNVGHRRWILNPRLSKLGLGIVQNSTGRVQTFGTVMASDQSHPRPKDIPFVAWPSPGKFPCQFLPTETPWSVSLNPMLYKTPGESGVTVLLRNETTGKPFRFAAKPALVKQGRMVATIDTDPFNWPACVIFRPPVDTTYQDGDIWSVKIVGLEDTEGRPAEISFVTEIVVLPSFPFPG